MRNLINPLDFTLDETISILDLADRIASNEEAYSHVADDKKLATLFYEPSTRTRLSFESAMLSLGGKTLGFAGANQSSATKGNCRRYRPCCKLLCRHYCNAPPKRRGAFKSFYVFINSSYQRW